MSNLSDREQKILDYMKEYVTKWGYPPTVRDIAAALGIRSTSTVHKAIASLEEKGFIKKQAGKRRAMDIVGSEPPQANVRSIVEERDDIVDLPVIGRIAAGTPILAEQNIEDSFPIPSRFVNGGTNFMLTVRGESMIEAGIMDGDYILVE
ncbi:MAG: repressor LexA, partial [Firmicutes bacterium]|nr:repressor LexA [Bacillota bacterium]